MQEGFIIESHREYYIVTRTSIHFERRSTNTHNLNSAATFATMWRVEQICNNIISDRNSVWIFMIAPDFEINTIGNFSDLKTVLGCTKKNIFFYIWGK